jgi:hypothetical protein
MSKYIFFIIFFFLRLLCIAQPTKKVDADSLLTRIVLIGDAGALVEGKPSVLNAMKRNFNFDNKTTVVFLGDNLYDYGLPDETYRHYTKTVAALDSQISLIKGTKAKAIMIPGNHDWANGKSEGYENIVRQQQYVDRFSNQNFNFLPKYGCPGPELVNISDDVVLIIMDSQWWLHTKDKPGIESDCDIKTEDEVITELKELLNKNYKKLVLIATHHPFKSNGPHGGYYTWKQHIFPFTDIKKNLYLPLPVIGSIYPITRSVFGSAQDLKNPKYTNMVAKMTAAIKTHPNVIMVAGHEHALQYIKDSNYNYIVSGSGCKTTRVSKGRKAEYAADSLGFATLNIYKSKNVGLDFYTISNVVTDSIVHSFSKNILDFSQLPVVEKKDSVLATYVYKDVVIAPASNQYVKLTGLKKIINGANYRKEWSTPIELKVFNINKEKGGFTIQGLGGGNQTKSLKLIDKNGVEWALRTIDKDPEKAIPENFRNTFASGIVKDMISASNPYGALVTHKMEMAVGIVGTKREYFFVPDDPSLGYYKNLFANTVCLLEKKEANGKEDNKSTFKVIDKMRDDNDHTVDEYAVLNARLFDMIIGDWDRHFDQWRWATNDTGKGKQYFPMPKDRDQAFFKSDGLLLKAIKSKMPFLQGFSKNLNDLSELNMVAKDFDRMFLNSIDKEKWDSITVSFITKLTDSIIRTSIKELPSEIYSIRGKQIEDKIISRRNQLQKKSLEYYNFLAKEVTITGSNKDELYKISNDINGNVSVIGFILDRNKSDTSFVTYNRVFSPKETNEIVIYGFNGDDKFIVENKTSSKILIRFIGGKGKDTFIVAGNIPTHIYDVTAEENSAIGNVGRRNHFSNDPKINRYDLKSYKYKVKSFPKLTLGYNVDDGFLIGGGLLYRNFRFRREPFANEHKLTTLFAVAKKAVQAKYTGTFMQLLSNTDVIVHAKLNMPALNNFYGLGNETIATQPKNFYLARYKEATGEVLFRRRKNDLLSYYFGPTVYHYWNRFENNEKLILGKPALVGLDSADVYNKYTYLGLKTGLDINNINNELLPTNGIVWENKFTLQKGINNANNVVSKLESDMTIYASLKIPAKVTGVIKLGGGKIFSDSVKYFQALTLGQNNNLRGFRKNRFSGNSLAYGSLEVRIKLLSGNSYILPGAVGLIVFNDVGRVWQKGESSNKWHYSYGGGLYFSPFNSIILSATYGKSENSGVFNFSIGSKFNLTF